MRPRGEVRVALRGAMLSLPSEGFTWRDAAHAACIGFDAARMTLENMARAGELTCVGTRPPDRIGRPMVVYAVPAAELAARPVDGHVDLQLALNRWWEPAP